MMSRITQLLPELDDNEMDFVISATKNLADDRLDEFAASYKRQRKNPGVILVLTLLGFIGIAGIQRFVVGQAGMGVLYLLTGGLFFIGTIYDIFTFKKLANTVNEELAYKLARRLG